MELLFKIFLLRDIWAFCNFIVLLHLFLKDKCVPLVINILTTKFIDRFIKEILFLKTLLVIY